MIHTSYKSQLILGLSTLVLLFGAVEQAGAVAIPAGAVVAPVTLTRGDGLNASFFDVAPPVGSNAIADGSIGGSPTATYLSTAVDYPNGAGTSVPDGTALSTYLGVDAGSLSGAGATTAPVGMVYNSARGVGRNP